MAVDESHVHKGRNFAPAIGWYAVHVLPYYRHARFSILRMLDATTNVKRLGPTGVLGNLCTLEELEAVG